jgi:hypothetical protein
MLFGGQCKTFCVDHSISLQVYHRESAAANNTGIGQVITSSEKQNQQIKINIIKHSGYIAGNTKSPINRAIQLYVNSLGQNFFSY